MRHLSIPVSSLTLAFANARAVTARIIFFLLAFWVAWPGSAGAGVSEFPDPLVIAVSRTYPPFTQIDIYGQPAGMFVDIWNLWSKKTGRAVTFKSDDWLGTLAALKSGEADIHSGLFYSAKRDEWMDYSRAFYVNSSSFYHRIEDTPPSSGSDLEGVKIGVVEGYLQETFLREAYPKAEIIALADDRELIKALAAGEIDLFLSEDPTIESLLAETGMLGRIGSVGAPIIPVSARRLSMVGSSLRNRSILPAASALISSRSSASGRISALG